MCYDLLTEEKRLVYAYDELQSLTDRSLPPPEEMFGFKADGATPNVQFMEPAPGRPSQDIILETCYRNSRPVLATAHALGFGIYRDVDPKSGTGLIQMFDNAQLWEDVGYSIKEGDLKDGQAVALARSPETSPTFLEEPKQADSLIEFLCFDTPAQQASWLVGAIEKNIKDDDLGYDDIIVINPHPLTTVKQVAAPRRMLFEKDIQSHVAGVDTASDVFFSAESDSVAFTGIFRAKGNEAGMVYVINGQDCYSSFGNTARIRNQLFTAITRSKAWVKVLGYGNDMKKLRDEFQRVVDANYELRFTYPDEDTRKHLNVINRDLTSVQKTKIKGAAATLNELLADITRGDVMIGDLPKEQVTALRALLSGQ
jgi:superfamily I DNA and RNA helicase